MERSDSMHAKIEKVTIIEDGLTPAERIALKK